MELVPWRPFGGELSSFRREMDRLWDRFFAETPLARRIGEEWWPSVDVSETQDNLVVKAELPGLEAKDVDVSISGDVLTIKGEKKKEEEEKDEHHHYVERYYGSFQRSFRLPSNVKSDKVEATFDKGSLRVTLQKVEEEEGVSAIVIGSHGKTNLEEMLLGSVSEKVIRKSKTPILVIKR